MDPIGGQLRRRRMAAGLSLTALSARIHYDKGYLSKVERGLRQPSPELVRDYDAVLEADGALAALWVPAPRTGTEPLLPVPPVPPVGEGGRLPAASTEDLALYERMFAAVRQLGQGTPAQTTLVPTHALHDLLARLVAAGGPARPGLRRLAAQCAEFLGWMYQERGEVGQAHRYTRIARDTAPDPDVVAYSWVRHAEISLSAGDTPAVFAYARRAYDDVRAADRVRGLAGHRMAQAFAVQRKATACRAALGAAERLFERDREVPRDGLGLGSTTVPDLCAATAGWCEYELGQHAVASDALARAVARIPATSRRARGVFGGRLSLSYAAAGDVRTACETGRMALDEVRHTRSATATADLRQLARYLRRWPGRTDAQVLAVDLAPVLAGPEGYSTG